MPNYTKLFNSIVTSTIWTEDDKTRIVWITMLALADQNGEVHASIPGLARLAGVPLADVESSIAKFLGPDPYSRTPTHEGRRIAAIEGGWELLNHAKYRRMASLADQKDANAKRQKRHRDRNATVTGSNATVTPRNATVTVKTDKAEAEAEAKAYTEEEASQPLQRQRAGGISTMDQIKAKVNTLRSEWGKMPHFSASENYTLQGCAHSLEGLDEASWKLMRDYLAYVPRGAEKLYQVRSREKFLQTPVDTLTAATEWAKMQFGSVQTLTGGKW